MKTQTQAVVKQNTLHGITGAALVTTKGKVVGARVVFNNQNIPASAIKEQLKAKGVKGAELKKQVNEVLTGGKDMAWALHDANVSAMRSAGFIPDSTDLRKTSATARFVRPESDEPQTISRDAALAALGLTEEQLKALAPAK